MARIERLLRVVAALVALYLLGKAVYTIAIPAADPRNRALEVVVIHVAFYGFVSFRFCRRAGGKAMDPVEWWVWAISALDSSSKWESQLVVGRQIALVVALIIGGWFERRLAASKPSPSLLAAGQDGR